MIVVDTNVLVQFAFEPGSYSRRVMRRDPQWAAPHLWQSEFRSALAGMIRIHGLPSGDAVAAFEQARAIVSLEPNPKTESVVQLVTMSRCSAYDLEFVAIALALNVPLVTNDKQLLAEFPRTAVSPQAFAA